MTTKTPAPTLTWLTPEQSERLRKRRKLKDYLARGGIALGGIGVLGAIMLIFFYLAWEVAPLFRPASIADGAQYAAAAPAGKPDLFLAVEEQNVVGFRFTAAGDLVFFDAGDGKVVSTTKVLHADVAPPTALAASGPGGDTLAAGFADGRVVLLHETYAANYGPDGQRSIDAGVDYPHGEKTFDLFPGKPVAQLAVRNADDGFTVIGRASDGALAAVTYAATTNMMTGETEIAEGARETATLAGDVQNLLLDADGKFLFIIYADGRVEAREIGNLANPGSMAQLPAGRHATASAMLLGGVSLLVGDSAGGITQLFLVRDADNAKHLTVIRALQLGDAPITQIRSEQRRKAFVAVDAKGNAGFFSTTAERLALQAAVAPGGAEAIAVSPRGDGLLVKTANGIRTFHVRNDHPDVSFKALWGKVWYEGYDEPKYIWQSSSANSDFEPKFSLTPLAFGTLKAAFFAMLLAMPLAICGAIFTAYFMAAPLRKVVKPTIELMAALPTVILGFLAGLWLAPLVESSLPGVFAMLIVMPVMIVIASAMWFMVPETVRQRIPDGYEPLLIMPVVVLAVVVPFALSGWMETTFFGGDTRGWLQNVAGIPFDQRNALIVGFAMGFAVIPTIYSIAEDALFEVPKHLTFGSLALGATPWQTLVRVILPTASPGIFSAVMIGFGRAVGETMIVLMATGNTPVMTPNIFEGLRTLSANIAVEMPESEVGSTHFRILFLAALVLFIFTFVFNTTAEIIRHRLRKKYGSL